MRWLGRLVLFSLFLALVAWLLRPVSDLVPTDAGATPAAPTETMAESTSSASPLLERSRGELIPRNRRSSRARAYVGHDDQWREVPVLFRGKLGILSAFDPFDARPHHLVAWEPDGDYYLATSVAHPDSDRVRDFGSLPAIAATGLEITLAGPGARSAAWHLRLTRPGSAEVDTQVGVAELLALKGGREAQVYAEPVPLQKKTLLRPIFPDTSVTLTFHRADEGRTVTREIVLQPGRIRTAVFDTRDLMGRDARDKHIDLIGKLVDTDTFATDEITIRKVGGRGQRQLIGKDGWFHFENLTRDTSSRFVVTLVDKVDGRETFSFVFDPRDLEDGIDEASVTWSLLDETIALARDDQRETLISKQK